MSRKQPPSKPAAHPAPKKAKPAPRRKQMMENYAQQYSSPAGTTAPEELSYPAGKETTTLTAEQVDSAAAAEVEREAATRVQRETKIPVTLPDLPPGLSPNEKIAMVSSQGTNAVTYPVTTETEPADEPQE
jgi:hypothetical protein